MTLRFDGRVAIVTGAGNGLGREHALALAAHGAKVVVNDLAGPSGALTAEDTAKEIVRRGGEAIFHGTSVTDPDGVQDMVEQTLAKWGQIDVLVNNAGILRDKSFAKMTADDMRLILDVHVMGAFHCTKAVWAPMKDANYGRIAMTSSVSGLYGNFGQSNYGAAKMALVGLMNSLHIEGKKNNIRINALAPTAYTNMLEGLVEPEAAELLTTESVCPGLLFLVSEHAPSKVILGAGAGCFAVTHIYETPGIHIPENDRTPDAVAEAFDRISQPEPAHKHSDAYGQTQSFVAMAKGAASARAQA